MVLMLTGRAQAAEVELEGEIVSSRTEIREGTAYIPLRELSEAAGGWTLFWDEKAETASAEGEHFSLYVPTDGSALLVEDAVYTVGGAYLKGGSVYVPLREVGRLLGFDVRWQGPERPIALSRRSAEVSEEDFYWLCRIISAESQGEPLLGQLAVGTVVLNRVACPDFPSTITDVIFDEAGGIQFEPVANGAVYWEPTARSVLAAQLVLSGVRAAGESLFFYAPALSEGIWINENREHYITIGCHKFYL